jgi:endo-1,4-beta-D-glucanase Y
VRFLLAGLALALCSSAPAASTWPDWDRYAERFIQADGRVIDITFDQKSTSEGQSYGLFFALVANDRARFDTILKWTHENLAGKNLGEHLPAWHWGKRDDGSWGVKDPNSASDGELWIAYALLEAARLWKAPAYEAIARKLMATMVEKEVVQAGDAGTLLLPGPMGFVLDGGERYRLDPSYLPGPVLRYFAHVDPAGPWQAIWDSYVEHTRKLYPLGIAPDLYVIDRKGRITPDPDRPFGGYDAIRVYLWAGMDHDREMLKRLSKFADIVRARGKPPEKIDPVSGKPFPGDYSPTGFSGALLPFFEALGDKEGLALAQKHLKTEAWYPKPTNYYDDSLILFGKGWLDGAYRFDASGRLVVRWAR